MKGSEQKKGEYVQYGCGFSAPMNWRNFDASPTLRFEKIPVVGGVYTPNSARFPKNVEYGDIVKGLPVAANSCSGIYASHVLEHLSLEDFRSALRNTFAILRPGGIFRLVVPDLEILAQRYIASKDQSAAAEFMRATSLGVVARPRSLFSKLRTLMGNSHHLWMWDFKALSCELTAAGFASIRRCAFNDSDDQRFSEVEEEERFVDAVAIECKKPEVICS